jgi:hypothetical protein
MGQRYRLEPRLTTPIGVPRHLPSRNLARFLDTVDRGRSHVEATDTPKAGEPSSRAAPSACSEIIRQC